MDEIPNNADEILDPIRKATQAIHQRQSEAVEALCLMLAREKGPRSVLDYELVQQLDDTKIRWWFQLRPTEDV